MKKIEGFSLVLFSLFLIGIFVFSLSGVSADSCDVATWNSGNTAYWRQTNTCNNWNDGNECAGTSTPSGYSCNIQVLGDGNTYCSFTCGYWAFNCCVRCCTKSICSPSCSCASNTCVGSSCSDGCGGSCSGTKQPDCGTRTCGSAPNGCGSCGTCPSGQSCTSGGSCCTSYTWYNDFDNDSWFNSTISSCTRPASFWKNDTEINITHSSDCNNSNAAINPAATEICGNTIDENCDNIICSTFINKPKWQNLIGQNISSANIGDSVLMYVPGVGLLQPINYTIYQNSSTIGVWQRFLNWLTRNSGVEYQNSTRGLQLWTAQQGAYYFEATIYNSTWSATNSSDNLDVSGTNNAMPVANITSPSDNLKTSVGYPISFNQASYDEDDLLNLTWDFGDSIINKTTSYSLALTPNIANTIHNYSSEGQYNVKLTATEIIRGRSSIDTRTIFVLKPGINVFPVITSPENGIGYGNWVNFNASQSFVANCSLGAVSPLSFVAGNLNCSYIHAPNTISMVGRNYNLILNWSVYTSGSLSLTNIGNWSSNYDDVVVFNHFFLNPSQHIARLNMDYLG